MRIIGINQKLVIIENDKHTRSIIEYLIRILPIKEINIHDLISSEKKNNSINSYAYQGNNYSYTLIFNDTPLDWVMVRPNFKNKCFIWTFLSDANLKYRSEIEKKVFEIATPISMEYGQQLNDRMVQTPSYVYLDKEYGEFATEKWLGFNIEWTFIVDFKLDIKSKIPKEVLLKAPAYKVEELDNGCVFVQLTEEEPIATEFDEEYVSAYIEFRKYCEEWIKVNK